MKPIFPGSLRPKFPVLSPKSKSEQFFWASGGGDLSLVKALASDPDVDPNWQSAHGSTSLGYACRAGFADVVTFLLRIKGIDVNLPNYNGMTPFYLACSVGRLEVIELLLSDLRIDVNKARKTEVSALWSATERGLLPVVRLLLASNREIDVEKRDFRHRRTAAEQARLNGSAKTTLLYSEEDFKVVNDNYLAIADLIDSYARDPEAVRKRLRREQGLDERLAGEMFALMIYVADGYLEMRQSGASASSSSSSSSISPGWKTGDERSRRFFKIAASLPMDLQMVLSKRCFLLSSSIVSRKYSELGFVKFGRSQAEDLL